MPIFPFDKLANAIRMIRANGGLIKSHYKLWRYDSLKEGRFVGQDCWGNRYYENNYYMLCRNRWVEYYDNCGWNYDGSMVNADWFGWLHHKTDKTPCEDEAKQELYCDPYAHRWLMGHQENLTGTNCAYYPYSTTPARIQPWDGQWLWLF
ncbi:NADH ubiquinone oxidoreductase subunit NDUFA12 domain-containing protein [Phthorimaea operculella]|nr:NADH ubiquinone oxidoreductase subunit NDUFA12 domain-containing protein [Phthorimaea operculella]